MRWREKLVVRSLVPIAAVLGVFVTSSLGWIWLEHRREVSDSSTAWILVLGVGGMALSVLGLVALILRRRVQKPVEELIAGFRALEGGHLTARIGAGMTGELGRLAAAFNHMANSIQSYARELADKSFELDKLHSMVGQLSRTARLDELREIVLDLVLQGLPGIEHVVIGHRVGSGASVQLHARRSGRECTESRTILPGREEEARDLIEPRLLASWTSGKITGPAVVGEQGLLFHGSCGEECSAVLYVRKRPLAAREERLLEDLSSHILLAMKNAALYTTTITDGPTGLHSVSFFHQATEEHVERHHEIGSDVSLLTMDLDGFTQASATHGGPTADAVLGQFVTIVRNCVRNIDVVCHHGRGRFGVVLAAAGTEAAMVVAERIRVATQNAKLGEGRPVLSMTVSIGIATYSKALGTWEHLLEAADEALRRAKSLGRNRAVAA